MPKASQMIDSSFLSEDFKVAYKELIAKRVMLFTQ